MNIHTHTNKQKNNRQIKIPEPMTILIRVYSIISSVFVHCAFTVIFLNLISDT